MSLADKTFKAMCEDILTNGYTNNGQNVRPHWEDGTPAYTIAKNAIVNKYDLSKEFPAITLRRTPIKTCTEEMLWIWQRKDNNVNNLDSTVWDEWKRPDGTIGMAYGYQQAKLHLYKIDPILLPKVFKDGRFNDKKTQFRTHDRLVASKSANDCWYMNQLDKAIYDLTNNPLSRRIIVTMWSPDDGWDMALEPCAYEVTFMTRIENNEFILDMTLHQRSNDILAAGNWNVCQYAVLQHMVARHVGMKVGVLTHVIENAHIYDRHIPIIENLIKREEYDAPTFWLDPSIDNFYDFTKDSVKLENYKVGEQVKNIPIAI